MRLGGFGGFTASTEEDLEALLPRARPARTRGDPGTARTGLDVSDECVALGEAARRLGLVVGETGMPEITDRAHRIQDADRPGRRAG